MHDDNAHRALADMEAQMHGPEKPSNDSEDIVLKGAPGSVGEKGVGKQGTQGTANEVEAGKRGQKLGAPLPPTMSGEAARRRALQKQAIIARMKELSGGVVLELAESTPPKPSVTDPRALAQAPQVSGSASAGAGSDEITKRQQIKAEVKRRILAGHGDQYKPDLSAEDEQRMITEQSTAPAGVAAHIEAQDKVLLLEEEDAHELMCIELPDCSTCTYCIRLYVSVLLLFTGVLTAFEFRNALVPVFRRLALNFKSRWLIGVVNTVRSQNSNPRSKKSDDDYLPNDEPRHVYDHFGTVRFPENSPGFSNNSYSNYNTMVHIA